MAEIRYGKLIQVQKDMDRLAHQASPEAIAQAALELGEELSDALDAVGLIEQGEVRVNGVPSKVAYRLRDGDLIAVVVPEPRKSELLPEEVAFTILHEDEDLLVIAKPPGLVVHPGCGHQTGTLVHGLLFHCDDLAGTCSASPAFRRGEGVQHKMI